MISRFLNRNREYIFCIVLLCVITGLNIYSYIDFAYKKSFYPIEGTNAFSFWYYVRTLNLGQILIFISPLIIIICGVSKLHDKLNSGIYQSILLKKKYNKFITKEIINSYLKSILIFPILSVFVFLIGIIGFGDKISILDSSLPILYLPVGLVNSPYIYYLRTIFLLVLYSIFIINIALILMQFVKKYYLLIISSFIVINAINFIMSNILIIISKIVNSGTLYEFAINTNIYDGYSPESKLSIAFITIGIYTIISFLIIFILYKKKERLIDLYD